MNERGFIPIVSLVVLIIIIITVIVFYKLWPSTPTPAPKPQQAVEIEPTSHPLLRDVVLQSPLPASKITLPTPMPTITPTPTVTPTPILKCPSSYNDAASFREFIFCSFGFNPEAAARIRNTTSIVVHDLSSTSGGGLWHFSERKVELFTAQREAAVHELSHAFWQDERQLKARRLQLVKDLIKLATLDKNLNFQYVNAINFAYEYVYGIGDWKGMFCAYNQVTCVGKDPKLLTDVEIVNSTDSWTILDHEIYAGFSSWTMGKFLSGPRILPDFMASHFTEQFSGNIKAVLNYEGGPP